MGVYKCEKCKDHSEYIPKDIEKKVEKCAICGKKMIRKK